MPPAVRFIASTLAVCVAALAGVAAVNAVVDPLMQYHAPGPTARFVTGFARHTNAGLARNTDYDAVLVGSSYSMNFRNSDFDREFGGRTLSMTMPGMFVSEGVKALKFATAQRPLKRVYFGLDFFAFVEADNTYKFPDYLYDDRRWNDAPYLISLDTLKRSAYQATGRGPANYNTDADMPWSWARPGMAMNREGVIADFKTKRAQTARKKYIVADMIAQARRELVPFVAAHPQTQFEFFLPPYSVLTWRLDGEHGELETLLTFRMQLAQLLAPYGNTRLHDFQGWEQQICNLDRYTDIGHYGPDDNRAMVSLMRKKAFLVEGADATAANARIRSLVSEPSCGAAVPKSP